MIRHKYRDPLTGGPVVHFLKCLTDWQIDSVNPTASRPLSRVDDLYSLALKNVEAFGGKPFHNSGFGGGIVFPDGESLRKFSDSLDQIPYYKVSVEKRMYCTGIVKVPKSEDMDPDGAIELVEDRIESGELQTTEVEWDEPSYEDMSFATTGDVD